MLDIAERMGFFCIGQCAFFRIGWYIQRRNRRTQAWSTYADASPRVIGACLHALETSRSWIVSCNDALTRQSYGWYAQQIQQVNVLVGRSFADVIVDKRVVNQNKSQLFCARNFGVKTNIFIELHQPCGFCTQTCIHVDYIYRHICTNPVVLESDDDSALMLKPFRRGLDLYTILYDNFMTIKRTSKIWGSEKLDRIILTYKYK